jgi:hypothetical protein
MTATAPADTRPMIVTAGMPAMARPMMAMTTVVRANSTAAPEVATAGPADSSTVIPVARCSRRRVTTKRA